MSDNIVLETGADPWAPSADAELKAVYHRFTIPLIGQVWQGGHDYLFWCVVGHGGPESAWAYALPDAEYFDRLKKASNDEFDDLVRQAVEGRTTAFAMASDDKGVSVSVYLDPAVGFDDVYDAGMPALEQKVNEAAEELRVLMSRFPYRLASVAPSRHRQPRVPTLS